MKRLLALLCAFSVILGILAGCGNEADDIADNTDIYENEPILPAPKPENAAVETELARHLAAGDTIFLADFEDNALHGFTPRNNERLTISTDYANTGKHSLLISANTENVTGVAVDVTDYIFNIAEYSFSVYVYIPDDVIATRFVLSSWVEFEGVTSHKQLNGPDSAVTVAPGNWVMLSGAALFESFDKAFIYIETTGQSDAISFYIDDAAFYMSDEQREIVKETLPSLKEAYADYFLIGTEGEASLFKPDSLSLHVLSNHFNAITADNSMKPENIQPEKGNFTFYNADRLLKTAAEYDFTVIGNTLTWHLQSPDWMNGAGVTRDEAVENLQTHITQVITHFGDDIHSWNVASDVFMDSIVNPANWRSALRDCAWRRAIGDDYIEIALRAAREANPDILLYYSDYNLDNFEKREAVYYMVQEFLENGVPIDGIAIQGHFSMNTSVAAVERSIERLSELGLLISIIELDVSHNNAAAELTAEQELEQAVKYAELFQVFKKYADVIELVAFWGISDGASRRSERFPLLFDRFYMAKESFWAVLDPDEFLAKYEDTRVLPKAKTAYAAYGAAVIGGDTSQWAHANAIAVDNYLMAWEGATGEARVLWNEEGLYILFTVADPLLNDSSAEYYLQDSIEVFIDENNAKSGSYQTEDFQIRVNYNNVLSYLPNMPPANKDVITYAQVGGGGYTVQLFYPFQTITPAKGRIIGFDLQVNDSDNNGQRVSIAKWNDMTDDTWRNTTGFGNLVLD